VSIELVLAAVAAILSIVEVARSRGQSLLAWAVLLLAGIHLLPIIPT
jgi:hypothetical protein